MKACGHGWSVFFLKFFHLFHVVQRWYWSKIVIFSSFSLSERKKDMIPFRIFRIALFSNIQNIVTSNTSASMQSNKSKKLLFFNDELDEFYRCVDMVIVSFQYSEIISNFTDLINGWSKWKIFLLFFRWTHVFSRSTNKNLIEFRRKTWKNL